MQIKWKKYGNYAITANGYSIAKYIVADNAKYGVWELPSNLIGFYKTPQEAKDEAVRHYGTQLPNSNRQDQIARYVKEVGNSYKRKEK